MLLFLAYDQLQVGTESLYKGHALFVGNTLNQRIAKDLAIEDKRSYSEYGFIRTVQVIGGEENTLSELVNYPITSQYAGMVGHFQLPPNGTLRTPLLPEGLFGKILLEQIPPKERRQREEVRVKIKSVLSDLGISNQGIDPKAQPRDSVESVIDQIYKIRDKDSTNTKKRRNQRTNRYEKATEKEAFAFNVESTRFDIIDSYPDEIDSSTIDALSDLNGVKEVEIEPFQATYNSQYIVFYRNVKLYNKRGSSLFIQGFVVDLRIYLQSLVKNEIQFYPQEQELALVFSTKNEELLQFGIPASKEATTHKMSLLAPLDGITLTMYSTKIRGAGAGVFLVFLGIVVLCILGGGLISIYNLTQSRLSLASKRQDFISAVSHELKTPLTSISMYAELLQNSWVANEEKRQKYYGMIASEACRLTRLIQNVLNLSKLDRNRWNVQITKARPKLVLDDFVAMYTKNVENKGFSLTVSSDTDVNDIALNIDKDAVMQILTNLVDNSLKFSKDAEYKMIVIELRIKETDVYLAVRDYGPGIPPSEMGKVFQEFYRVENEMTRKTSGTGIGLSMVQKLCKLTGMRIEIENANPGLRTKIHFPPISL